MSKLYHQFFENQLDIEVKRRYDDYSPIKLDQSVAEDISYDELLKKMAAVKTLEEHAGKKARVYGQTFLEKLKLSKAPPEILKDATDAANYYGHNITNPELRKNQVDRMTSIAQKFEPDAGKPKSIFKKLFS